MRRLNDAITVLLAAMPPSPSAWPFAGPDNRVRRSLPRALPRQPSLAGRQRPPRPPPNSVAKRHVRVIGRYVWRSVEQTRLLSLFR